MFSLVFISFSVIFSVSLSYYCIEGISDTRFRKTTMKSQNSLKAVDSKCCRPSVTINMFISASLGKL